MPPSGPSAPQTAPQSSSAVPTGKEGPFSIDLSLAAVSDYRFRGTSLSNKDPVFQPSLTLTHKSGLYASVWGSNITDNGGDNIEVDLVGGYSGQTGSVSYGINATY